MVRSKARRVSNTLDVEIDGAQHRRFTGYVAIVLDDLVRNPTKGTTGSNYPKGHFLPRDICRLRAAGVRVKTHLVPNRSRFGGRHAVYTLQSAVVVKRRTGDWQ